ncbi:MAG: Lipoyl synthase [Chloroflexota bacterium]|jgi:lipoic acid synthetase|nr:lipoyl synthase [Dehalococcoidia bacterium]CAI8372052.1 MAG: Lipoyl synthase [Chloroflexota bacterium]|tara:strand:+ start:2351 stop:3232 length:882 start_codon:yes stop_codon:yes gene_type:complete
MPEKRTSETRLPPWIKAKMPGGPKYMELKELMRKKNLHTVCEEAHCPNIGECWERGTATFMILGEICTRACRYCAVTTGKPNELDTFEPIRVAESVKSMNLSYCVITAVNRDDLSDGGAAIFADCIKRIRETSPHCKVEVLIPDLQGNWDALKLILDQKPDVLNHNIESTREIFPLVRAKGDYDLSLELLAKSKAIDPSIVTKSGIIVGMGENTKQLKSTMQDLREVDCDLLTIGQYLRPSQKHLKTVKYYKPDEFEDLKQVGLNLGFKHVASGPLVRSSYHADEQHMSATTV